VLVLDESGRLMNRQSAVLFTTPFPSEPNEHRRERRARQRRDVERGAPLLGVDEGKRLPLVPIVMIAEPDQMRTPAVSRAPVDVG
jgi:hypothetical protein